VSNATDDSAPIDDPPSGVIVALHSVICSQELLRSRWRAPDYENENRALMKMAAALATSPSDILQTLVETISEGADCDSAAVSLLTSVGGQKRLYWPATVGLWGKLAAVECLKAPFSVEGIEIGAVWAVMHSNRRRFDAEDERLMVRLGRFGSLAYQSLRTIESLRSEIVTRQESEAQVREWTAGWGEASEKERPQLKFARADRLATFEQLSISISHQINQPIAAAVANADAALHWLGAEPPNLEKAKLALARILENGRRASELIAGIGPSLRR
jgi:C4-dicarboxylate-specific signal transduction histidine kinase